MCFGGGSTPTPPAPPPPPQYAQAPAAAAVRADTAGRSGGQVGSTILTGGLGDPLLSGNGLGKKTLLGQ